MKRILWTSLVISLILALSIIIYEAKADEITSIYDVGYSSGTIESIYTKPGKPLGTPGGRIQRPDEPEGKRLGTPGGIILKSKLTNQRGTVIIDPGDAAYSRDSSQQTSGQGSSSTDNRSETGRISGTRGTETGKDFGTHGTETGRIKTTTRGHQGNGAGITTGNTTPQRGGDIIVLNSQVSPEFASYVENLSNEQLNRMKLVKAILEAETTHLGGVDGGNGIISMGSSIDLFNSQRAQELMSLPLDELERLYNQYMNVRTLGGERGGNILSIPGPPKTEEEYRRRLLESLLNIGVGGSGIIAGLGDISQYDRIPTSMLERLSLIKGAFGEEGAAYARAYLQEHAKQ